MKSPVLPNFLCKKQSVQKTGQCALDKMVEKGIRWGNSMVRGACYVRILGWERPFVARHAFNWTRLLLKEFTDET